MRTVEGEDFPVGEDMQRGFHSLAQSHITFGAMSRRSPISTPRSGTRSDSRAA